MPDRQLAIQRAGLDAGGTRPVMVAIAGDSAAGKTTLAKGIVTALGAERVASICVDDYHRYDREERKRVPFTALHPDCNYVEIMEQHLQLLALGQPVLKPVYNHANGRLERPLLVKPRELVVCEGLLPLSTKVSRACFDVGVYLDPPERVRRVWKLKRDTGTRSYTPEQVAAELERREPESAAFIRPQKADADIVVSFAPLEGRGETPEHSPSATILLRPTVPHPNLAAIITEDVRQAIHLKLTRDEDGRPVDAIHVHGYAPPGPDPSHRGVHLGQPRGGRAAAGVARHGGRAAQRIAGPHPADPSLPCAATPLVRRPPPEGTVRILRARAAQVRQGAGVPGRLSAGTLPE